VVFGVIEDSLRGFETCLGSYATKRYGAAEDPNVREACAACVVYPVEIAASAFVSGRPPSWAR
jgi:hypothetical protein